MHGKKRRVGSLLIALGLIWELLDPIGRIFTGYDLARHLTGHFLIPGIAVLGLTLIAWDFVQTRTATKNNATVTAADWKEIAKKFERLPPTYVRAEWYSETLDNDGKPFGEQWLVRDDWHRQFAADCEVLCQLAGAMLLRSPKVCRDLSQKVVSRSSDVWRCLYFLAETRGCLKITAHGTTTIRGFTCKDSGGEIAELAPESARACLACAAKEL